MAQKVWLITGCSSGFGLEIARSALARGHLVVASSRNPEKNPEVVEEIKAKGGDWISLDVCRPEADVKQIVDEAAAIHGRVDFLVNNAGYGTMGGFEDWSEDELRAQFETNVFGLFKTTKAVLPIMRKQGGGALITISSTSGLRAMPAVSLYASSKFAVEGMTESLASEYAPFGVKALIVEPGAFRTNFAGGIHQKQLNAFYKGTPAEAVADHIGNEGGKQPGDPRKAAERILDVALGEGMAREIQQFLRLPLGRASYKAATAKVDNLSENFKAVRNITESADYDE